MNLDPANVEHECEEGPLDDLIDSATEALAINIVLMSCDDAELIKEFYQDVCIALRDQIALKLAGHTDEPFH